jgi:hypothetical protein
MLNELKGISPLIILFVNISLTFVLYLLIASRAFRRLLFLQDKNSASSGTGSDATAAAAAAAVGGDPGFASPTAVKRAHASGTLNEAPDARMVLKQSFVSQLRPSTLLGYLVSCAPAQLPAPYEVLGSSAAGAGAASAVAGGAGAIGTGGGSGGGGAAVGGLSGSGSVGNLSGAAAGASAGPVAVDAHGGVSDLVRYIDILTDVMLSQHVQSQQQQGRSQSNQQQTLSGFNSVRSLYAAHGEQWNSIVNEKQCWALMQQALDIYFQRITVVDGAQKQAMRLWYESILDVGSKLF